MIRLSVVGIAAAGAGRAWRGAGGADWTCCWLQLRVVRAFKSTLEDLEERLSAHSAATLRSRLRAAPPDIAYIDADDVPAAARTETTIF